MASPTESSAAPSVLVVDDNEMNRSLARMTLRQEGYDVRLASSGEDALRQFTERPAACVLLDVRMPGMDGPTACARIRALPHGATAAIIFLTAARDVATFDSAVRAGGDDFLTKPVQPDELLLRVAAALKVRRLDAERHQLFRTVQQQRDALMRVQLQKDQLMGFIVHDLINPVSTIDLQAQVMQDEEGLPMAAREMLVNIRGSTRALRRMILNLLDVSRADDGQLQPSLQTVELDALLDDLLATFQLKAQGRDLRLVSDLDVTEVNADADLLSRILENLIENALRYAPRGSAIEISSRAAQGGAEIRVRDAGPGVPEAARERIFERFAQIDSPGPRGNRGLGLAFCKHAVEVHGGTIQVEDASPGAAFRFVLPAPASA